MNDRIAALGVSALLVAALVAFYFLTYTREEYQEFVAPTGEARHNPLLAAQRLLSELGYDVTSKLDFVPSLELPSPDDTIVLGVNYRRLSEDDIAVLMAWVERGGHLLVQIQPRLGRIYDPVFTALGIDAKMRPHTGPHDATVASIDETDFKGREFWGDIRADNHLSIDFGDTQPIWTVRDQHGVFAGQVSYAAGLLTVVADLAIMHNDTIGQRDHAYILTRLLGQTAQSGRVWLVYGGVFPGLASLLWEHAHFLFKALAVVVLLVIWWAGQRFGPRIAPPSTARKAFLEHISANGRFLWRHRQRDDLLGKTQHAFLRDAQRRHNGVRNRDSARRNAYLAEVCDMPRASVDNALGPLQRRQAHEFFEKMQLLKRMWNQI